MLQTLMFQCVLCVLGQAADVPPTMPTVPESAPELPNRLLPPDRVNELPRQYRPTPPELVAEALMLPPGHTLPGQPIALVSVLSAARERAEQLEVVRAYWQLAEAVAVYRFQLDYDRELQQIQAPPQEAARLTAAQAASKAQLSEAELRAVAAQHAITVQARFLAELDLPLPADRPHVGPYMTRFDELFGNRPAPATARRLARTLPIRFQAIEAQANAVAAAKDACETTKEDTAPDQWVERLDGLAELHRLQCAWIGAVCRYNQDIAEYAVAVAPPGTNGAGLVSLLIKPSAEPVRPLVSGDASEVQPAGLMEPVREPANLPRQPTPANLSPGTPGEPTPAVRPSAGEPTPAKRPSPAPVPDATLPPPSDRAPAPEPDPAAVLPQRPVVPIDRPTSDASSGDSGDPPPVESTAPEAPSLFEAEGEVRPAWQDAPAATFPQSRTAQRRAAVLPALYPGLADASPGLRTKQLTLTLHWNRSWPEGAGEPLGLLACLQRRTADRRDLLTAYWTVRDRAAAWQVREQHGQWLDELSFSVAEDSPEASRLQTARLVAEAFSVAAHAELVEAQFYLAEAVGQSSDTVWPIATTRPHAGPYLLKFEALPVELARSWPLRRLADLVPRLSVNVRDQAVAVVEADAARVETEAAWLEGAAPFDEVLHSLDRQTDQTLAFLAALTAYNHAIADYALRVLPDGTPDEQLIKTLVMEE